MSTETRVLHFVGGPFDGQTQAIAHEGWETLAPHPTDYETRVRYVHGKAWKDEHGTTHAYAYYEEPST